MPGCGKAAAAAAIAKTGLLCQLVCTLLFARGCLPHLGVYSPMLVKRSHDHMAMLMHCIELTRMAAFRSMSTCKETSSGDRSLSKTTLPIM